MKDRLLRAIAKDAEIQMTAVCTHEMVERVRQIHKTLPIATAALGRTLTASSMMGNQMKIENGSVTIQIKGNGPLGTIVAISDSEGNARGYLQNPAVELPLRADGKLDVGEAVGQGYLMVIKDVGMKEPVTGTVALVNGEIAEDITKYFAESEQLPSACALGVLIDTDQSVKQAGGYLVQLMPGATEAQIDRLEQNIARAGAITTMLNKGTSLEGIVRLILDGFDIQILGESPVAYHCACNHDKVQRALISMGAHELEQIVQEEKKIEVTCQFCDKTYPFSSTEIAELLSKARR